MKFYIFLDKKRLIDICESTNSSASEPLNLEVTLEQPAKNSQRKVDSFTVLLISLSL